jgi:CRP/FNR family transcriptional regulator, cyclic AMP receptor protein
MEAFMACDPNVFAEVPIFSLLDADERAILADHVELRRFVARQRIYKMGDPGSRAYIVLTGRVEVSMVDEEHRPVVVDTPQHGEIFGLSSMLAESAHLTTAVALEDTSVIEIDRHDITALLQRKPMAGLDMLTMVGKQFRAAQELVRMRVVRNPNEEIAEAETIADRVADRVARFGGSWRFIGSFCAGLIVYVAVNVILPRPWDPYPYILLNLFLSMLAAVQAPVIMMSQNRQDAKDRLRGELDYRVNMKAEVEVSQVLDRLSRVEDQLDAALDRRAGGGFTS